MGRRGRRRAVHGDARIIPHVRRLGARVMGITGGPSGRRRCGPDHPRSTRVKNEYTSLVGRFFGSSPRTRGSHERGQGRRLQERIILAHTGITARVRRLRSLRIIPAHTGITHGSGPCLACLSVHPRLHGDHGNSATRAGFASGSSQRVRVRGSLPRVPRFVGCPRIIPAHTGVTAKALTFAAEMLGSSPRNTGITSWGSSE